MSRRTRAFYARVLRAAVPFVILGSVLTSPPSASAQVGPLIVTVSSPGGGSTVGGTITVTASVSPVGILVQGVQFQLDGNNLGAEDTAAPYSVPWNTLGVANGPHTVRAIARDGLGIWYPSDPVTVTVFNDRTPPNVSITSPTSGAIVTGIVAVTASASDNVGVAGVQFRLDGAPLGAEDTTAPYSATWNSSNAAEGSAHILSAVARDAAGNTTQSLSVTVTILDKTPPTAAVTSPSPGEVSGIITVTAVAADNVGVAGVRFQLDGASLGAEDTVAPYTVSWDTSTATPGSHSLRAIARDAANNTAASSPVTVTVLDNVSRPGDVFVALLGGVVQWRNADGSFRQNLPSYGNGQVSSVAFDAAGNLYVPNWYGTVPPPGNTVVRYDPSGTLMGTFGTGYDANPSSVTFDADGNVYVGQADGTGDILKFDPAGNLLASFDVAVGNRGTDHIDLGSDGCTMFYTSRTQDVFRYDVCTRTQLPKLNIEPLSGYEAYHVRVLPDGGVLVADTQIIVRLDAAGNQIQTYFVTGETNYWGGLDVVGDGTFWASNAHNANIYKFDLQSGAVRAGFNAAPGQSAAGVGVRPIQP